MLFKNMSLLLLATFVVLNANAFSAKEDPCKKEAVCCQEPPPGPFAFSYAKEYDLSCPSDFSIYGEFLLMQIEEDGLEFAIINHTVPDIRGEGPAKFDLPLKGSTTKGFATGHSTWDWKPGFRVGFDYYLSNDKWNIDVVWTYLHSNEKSSASATPFGIEVPLVGVPISIQSPDLQQTHARWEFTLNSLDMTMSKPFHASRYFVLNPALGFRVAFIKQNFDTKYFGNFFMLADKTNAGEALLQAEAAIAARSAPNLDIPFRNDFWGLGFRGAVNTEWFIGAHWNLFGKVGGSLLYSKFETEQSLAFGPFGSIYEIDNDFYTVTPTMDIAIGANWEHYFSHNQYRFSMRVAYEFHYWWKQNHLRKLFETTNNIPDLRGDLQFTGFSFGMQFDF